ncbi:Ubiquitin carboxyl-terminal hydrolase 6 [Smittium mucronatum]|uniref:Ubiquitin carboxyl-terminal hydrolase n=1 Tax=Smittium mucronatum TaxID=133383 RepID=A0A1R0H595_9FUNG|nr:Ubiquitin carboxyl-terminal hydrolase 6 [Smittium mucronatum]
MIGSVGGSVSRPSKPQKFLEDMTYEEVAKELKLASGLTNLGNTCYMSSTLQCLNSIKELTSALNHNQIDPNNSSTEIKLTNSLRDLFNTMNKKSGTVMPMAFLVNLRQINPGFNEIDRQSGIHKQQDAEECWNSILSSLSIGLKAPDLPRNFVDSYLSGELVTTYQCDENPEEPPTISTESFRKLDCRIDKSVNYLQQGLNMSLVQKISKHSPSLGRDAEYTATSRIGRLPKYLAINFLRFFWKAKENIDAKIVKKVKFPFELDMTEYLTPELSSKLKPAREYLNKRRDVIESDRKRMRMELVAENNRLAGVDSKASSSAANSSNAAATTSTIDEEPSSSSQALQKPTLDPSIVTDIGCNPSGMYELIAVLTHIGRNVNSGHYIAWVKKESDENFDSLGSGVSSSFNMESSNRDSNLWYKFDDDRVSIVDASEIQKLDGGGDWHTAYITLYRAKSLD